MLLCSPDRGVGMGIGVGNDVNDDEEDSSLLKSRHSMLERQVMYKTRSPMMTPKD